VIAIVDEDDVALCSWPESEEVDSGVLVAVVFADVASVALIIAVADVDAVSAVLVVVAAVAAMVVVVVVLLRGVTYHVC